MTRIHGTTTRQVRAMLEEEQPFLQQLPLSRFEYYGSASGPCTSMATLRSTAHAPRRVIQVHASSVAPYVYCQAR